METNVKLCTHCGFIHNNQECTVNSTTFIWKYGGKNVLLTGDWNQWQVYLQMNPLPENKNWLSITLNLKMGVYQYKFIVDGEWHYDITKPSKEDGKGSFNNIIEVYPRAIIAEQSDDSEEDEPIIQGDCCDVAIKIRTNLDLPHLHIIGDWNNWQEPQKMKRKFSHIHNNYQNEVKLHLQPGKYEYKFLSGDIYLHDSEHKISQNQFGTYNNIIFVTERLKSQTKKKYDKWVWTSSKVSNEFQFDYMLTGHSINFVDSHVYIFGGIRGGQYLDNFYKYNVKDQEIEHVQYSGIAPTPRAFHKTVSFGNKILYYGGIDQNQTFQDYYVFNTTSNDWTKQNLTGQGPSIRERYSLSIYKKTAAIIFGGYYCTYDQEYENYYNNLFCLNLQKMCWLELKPEGDLPAPRFAHTSNSFKQYIVIFGGLSKNSEFKDIAFNDAWKIGLENSELQWENISQVAKGQPPTPRYGHSATVVNEYLVIFGGKCLNKQSLNDTYLLDMKRNEWIKPDISGDIPKPRHNHAACQLFKKDGVIIFGGNLIFNRHKNLDLSHGFLFYYLKPDLKNSSNLQDQQQQQQQNQQKNSVSYTESNGSSLQNIENSYSYNIINGNSSGIINNQGSIGSNNQSDNSLNPRKLNLFQHVTS